MATGFLIGMAMGVVILGGIVVLGMIRERRARRGSR